MASSSNTPRKRSLKDLIFWKNELQQIDIAKDEERSSAKTVEL